MYLRRLTYVIRVGINGFGRIGRMVLRQSLSQEGVEVVAVNDLFGVESFAHLLKYDTAYGKLPEEVAVDGDDLMVAGRRIQFSSEKDPAHIPRNDAGVEVVIESTGVFRDRDSAAKHLEAGASRVIISAPAKDPDCTLVLGVNHEDYDPKEHRVISNASCTTNCLAPMVRVLDDLVGVERGLMNTVHAYTADQQLVDGPHKDLRRARAAAANVVPTTTGAAVAVGEVLPTMRGRLDGFAVRVPLPSVSLLDLTVVPGRETDVDEINRGFRGAAEGAMKGILAVTDEALVSSDFLGDTASATVDLGLTQVVGARLVKVVAWYDNEMGYATRIVELAAMVGEDNS
ncbi:MAG: type I glyceraldehyde-3-phosphate dehydrogenase [Bacillota bacterium]